MDAFLVEHKYICLDPNARNLRHTYVTPADDKRSWRVQQMLIDPEELNDWMVEFEIDLIESRVQGRARPPPGQNRTRRLTGLN